MSSFVTGSATSFATVQAAVIAACVADGWASPASNIIAKGDCFIQFANAATYLSAVAGLGQAGGVLSSPAPSTVYLMDPLTGGALTWPMTYDINIGDTGVVVVLNFSVDRYIYLMFGQDPVAGLPGKGVWVSASGSSSGSGPVQAGTYFWTAPGFGSNGSQNNIGTGPFMIVNFFGRNSNSYVHHGLDGGAWSATSGGAQSETPSAVAKALGGIGSLMLKYQPNAWNNEAVLVPIQPYIDRTSNKSSIVADINIARFLRIDNYLPGTVITLGAEKWKVYPLYKKDTSNKLTYTGSGEFTHTGTLGMAVRYFGP